MHVAVKDLLECQKSPTLMAQFRGAHVSIFLPPRFLGYTFDDLKELVVKSVVGGYR